MPRIAIIMGSESDYETMRHAEEILIRFGVPYDIQVISAHRTPERMFDFAKAARAKGFEAIIAGAGGAAHLPGMVAALTTLPVLGVPIESKALNGLDSLLSIVQMPAGVPTATFSIGSAGAINASLFAVQMLAVSDESLASQLTAYRDEHETAALESSANVRGRLAEPS